MTMDVADDSNVDDPAGSSDMLDSPIFLEGDRLRRRISDDYAKGRKRQRIGQEPATMTTSLPLATTTTTSVAAVVKAYAQESMAEYSAPSNQDKHGAAAASSIPRYPSTALTDANIYPPYNNHRISISPSNRNSIGISNNYKSRMDQALTSKPTSLPQIYNKETKAAGAEANAEVRGADNSLTRNIHSDETSIMASLESMRISPTSAKAATSPSQTHKDMRETSLTTATAATNQNRSPNNVQKATVFLCLMGVAIVCVTASLFASAPPVRLHGHLLPPKPHGRGGTYSQTQIGPDGTTTTTTMPHPIPTDRTLRDFLTDSAGFHLALAPSFFGFYGYFGVLAAWQEGIDASILSPGKIHSVAGASAGAMAAILIAAGIKPRRAADFVANMTLGKFADYPAVGAFLRGHKFEQIMFDFLRSEQPDMSLLLQDSILPVAVTAFDVQSMEGKILSRGSMARAARASATFPVLFQPVGWKGNVTNGEDYILIDGGVSDCAGVDGLQILFRPDQPKRVVNVVVGGFTGSGPPGPSAIPGSTQVLSISMQNLPICSPLHMANGPITVDAAHRAMMATLDLPLYQGREANHFELHIDTGPFWKGEQAKH